MIYIILWIILVHIVIFILFQSFSLFLNKMFVSYIAGACRLQVPEHICLMCLISLIPFLSSICFFISGSTVFCPVKLQITYAMFWSFVTFHLLCIFMAVQSTSAVNLIGHAHILSSCLWLGYFSKQNCIIWRTCTYGTSVGLKHFIVTLMKFIWLS